MPRLQTIGAPSTVLNNTPGRRQLQSEQASFGASRLGGAPQQKNPFAFDSGKFQGYRENQSRGAAIRDQFLGGVQAEGEFYNRNIGNSINARQNLVDTLDPRNDGALVRSFGDQMRAGIGRQGKGLFNRLGGRSGVGDQRGLRQGALLSASNQANRSTGNFAQQLFNPMNRAQRYQGQLNALDPRSFGATQFTMNQLNGNPTAPSSAFGFNANTVGQIAGIGSQYYAASRNG